MLCAKCVYRESKVECMAQETAEIGVGIGLSCEKTAISKYRQRANRKVKVVAQRWSDGSSQSPIDTRQKVTAPTRGSPNLNGYSSGSRPRPQAVLPASLHHELTSHRLCDVYPGNVGGYFPNSGTSMSSSFRKSSFASHDPVLSDRLVLAESLEGRKKKTDCCNDWGKCLCLRPYYLRQHLPR